jgi:hypothetical protein
MGVETALMLGAGGSLIGGAGNILQGRSDRRQARRTQDRMFERAEGLNAPGFLESLLRSQFNVGQDGGMQMLRAVPGTTLDPTEFFESLAPIRQRQHQTSLAELQATSPGLGQRFGSAMMREGADLTERHLQNISAQDAATSLQIGQGNQNAVLSLLQLLGQLEQGRGGMQLGAFQSAGAMPMGSPVDYGAPLVDMGQILLLQQLLGGQQQTANRTPFQSPNVGSPFLPAQYSGMGA